MKIEVINLIIKNKLKCSSVKNHNYNIQPDETYPIFLKCVCLKSIRIVNFRFKTGKNLKKNGSTFQLQHPVRFQY